MAIKVMLDVFSGHRNPVWELPPPQETELLSRLQALPIAHADALPEPPGLGYRGFVIYSTEHPELQVPVMVYNGMVQHADEQYRDVSRELERWLLSSAGPDLSDNLKKEIEREVESEE